LPARPPDLELGAAAFDAGFLVCLFDLAAAVDFFARFGFSSSSSEYAADDAAVLDERAVFDEAGFFGCLVLASDF